MSALTLLRKGKDYGFTLTELLVVMATISLLAAMLLPVLNKSVAVARLATYANNLKQLGAVVIFYADDNAGRLADPWQENRHPWWLIRYNYYLLPTKPKKNANQPYCWFTPYGFPEIYDCPSQVIEYPVGDYSPRGAWFKSTSLPTTFANGVTAKVTECGGYGANSTCYKTEYKTIPPDTSPAYWRIARLAVKRPSQVAQFTDYGYPGGAENNTRAWGRHNGIKNFLFHDSHVKAISRTDVPKNAAGVIFWQGDRVN